MDRNPKYLESRVRISGTEPAIPLHMKNKIEALQAAIAKETDQAKIRAMYVELSKLFSMLRAEVR